MKKLILFALLFIVCRGFSQAPLSGQFYNYYDSTNIWHLPIFIGDSVSKVYVGDSLTIMQFAKFGPSVLQQYTDQNSDIFFGLDLDGRDPQAKLDINFHHRGLRMSTFPGLRVLGGNGGINASGSEYGVVAQGAVGLNAFGTDFGIKSTGAIGMDVTGTDKGICIHNNSLTSGYGIYQIGSSQGMNYFSSRIGIGVESPSAMLDISGDLKCSGPVTLGTNLDLINTPLTSPFLIQTANPQLDFNFPLTSTGVGSGGGENENVPTPTAWRTVMSLLSSGDTAITQVNGLTHTQSLSVDSKAVTNYFRMIYKAGVNKAMISDKDGNATWTDITPWINRYWVFDENANMYSQGINIGIGILPGDSTKSLNGKVTIVSNNNTNGLFVSYTGTGKTRHGIELDLLDNNLVQGSGEGNITKADTTGVGDTGGGGGGVIGGNGISTDGIYSKVTSTAGGTNSGSLTGFHTEMFDNASCLGGVFGVQSIIGGSFATNNKYGIYSEIKSGTAGSKWAGYFKGGDVEINQGSLIIGKPGDKRFCIYTHYLLNNQHTLFIAPEINGSWASNRGIAISDSGNLYADGKIYARAIEVSLDTYPIPDYVFAQNYKLLPLEQLETYVKENQHLPEIPSAKEIIKNGENLGEMNEILLKKVEELTLYIIEMKKEINELKQKK
jgi:hypothetical protein